MKQNGKVVNNPSQYRAELLLQRLLKTRASFADVCDELVQQFSKQSLSREDLEIISTFFIYAGQTATLVQLLSQFALKGLQIPWAHFTEALFLSSQSVPDSVKAALISGAETQGQLAELSRSTMLDDFAPQLIEIRAERKKQYQLQIEERKQHLRNQAEILKGQGLYEEEGRILDRLHLLDSDDPETLRQIQQRKKRKNLGLLHEIIPRKPAWIPLLKYSEVDPETAQILINIEEAMQEILAKENQNELLAQDFAIAQLMFDNEEAGLRLLDKNSPLQSTQWLRFELLLRARQFVALLEELQLAERTWVQMPDAIYGLLYFRAQAYWEMGQKQYALEIMESITIARPDYRNAAGILSVWKGSNP